MYQNGYISKRKRKKKEKERAAGIRRRSLLREIQEDIFRVECSRFEREAAKVRQYEARFRGGSHEYK